MLRHTDEWSSRLPPYLEAAAHAMTSTNPRTAQCMRDVDGAPSRALDGRDFCTLGGTPHAGAPQMLLWGDSFADMFQPIVDDAANRLGAPGIVATEGGCPPWRGKVFASSSRGKVFASSSAEVFSGYERYANFVFDTFMKTLSIRLVVIAGDWQRYDPAYEGNVLAEIAHELERRGGRMVLVGAVPNPHADVPRDWARRQTEAGHAASSARSRPHS
ncbi:hypothetical protein BUMB_02583c [Candidatus Paraburkholderia calva]|nr:hypothetical protein BUMB_02583c [Candidatus Paraburkholderia calva]